MDNLQKKELSVTLPDHLKQMFENSSANLTPIEKDVLKDLLLEYETSFSRNSQDLGQTSIVKHKIETGMAQPIKQRPRRVPQSKREEVSKVIKEMEDQGIIEPSISPWASPIVLVKKKNGETRFCIDYRKLNDVTVKDSHPLPRTDDCLDALSGSVWFSALDLKSGYWQEEDRVKTAFTTSENGFWQFRTMPFGLCNAPATFERLMEHILSGLNRELCLVYLDDIIVTGKSFTEHISNLRKVFNRLKGANLKLNPKKCQLFRKEVKFLGHVVSENGISTDTEKVQAVKEWPTPKTVKEIRSFLGLCSYYRRFIKNFAEIAKPLHQLTEKGKQFLWTEKCEDAFSTLKEKLVSSPILAYPKEEGMFILDTDACDTGIGAVLSQVQEGIEKVIAYYSRTLSKPERRYCVTRKELLAVVAAI